MTNRTDPIPQDVVRTEVLRIVAAMAGGTVGPEIAGTDNLVQDLGFDSVRLIELTMVLERAFGLPVHRPEQLAGVVTVDDVVALVCADKEVSGDT